MGKVLTLTGLMKRMVQSKRDGSIRHNVSLSCAASKLNHPVLKIHGNTGIVHEQIRCCQIIDVDLKCFVNLLDLNGVILKFSLFKDILGCRDTQVIFLVLLICRREVGFLFDRFFVTNEESGIQD